MRGIQARGQASGVYADVNEVPEWVDNERESRMEESVTSTQLTAVPYHCCDHLHLQSPLLPSFQLLAPQSQLLSL